MSLKSLIFYIDQRLQSMKAFSYSRRNIFSSAVEHHLSSINEVNHLSPGNTLNLVLDMPTVTRRSQLRTGRCHHHFFGFF